MAHEVQSRGPFEHSGHSQASRISFGVSDGSASPNSASTDSWAEASSSDGGVMNHVAVAGMSGTSSRNSSLSGTQAKRWVA